MTETAKIAMANGVQLGIHAIGDRANREVLDIYERAFRDQPTSPEAKNPFTDATALPGVGECGLKATREPSTKRRRWQRD